jgi:hypothetical protein
MTMAATPPLLSLLVVYSVILTIFLPTTIPLVTAYDWHCNLYCYNGGSCRHGHGKFGSYSGITDGIEDNYNKEDSFEHVKTAENGMFCTCPVGYTGLQCEIKFVVCDDDNISRMCNNGSTCKKERAGLTGETYHRCECDPKGSVMDSDYAGNFCEHISTVFCSETADGMEHGTSYCANGGKVRVAIHTEISSCDRDVMESWTKGRLIVCRDGCQSEAWVCDARHGVGLGLHIFMRLTNLLFFLFHILHRTQYIFHKLFSHY